MQTFPRKSLAPFTQQIRVSASSAQNATNLLHLHPHEATVARELHDLDLEARPSVVHAEEVDVTLVALAVKHGCVSVATDSSDSLIQSPC